MHNNDVHGIYILSKPIQDAARRGNIKEGHGRGYDVFQQAMMKFSCHFYIA